MTAVCKSCGVLDRELSTEGWTCSICGAHFHVDCVTSNINVLLKGDRLFSFECKGCSYEKCDVLKRLKLTWLQVIHLVLYNLTVSTSGRQGYFRWREDICGMIDQHWPYLIPDRNKTSTWRSTVAGTLSVHCPKVFKSGVNVFKESGWWALTEVKAPAPIADEEPVRNKSSRKGKASADLLLITADTSEAARLELEAVKYGRGKRQRKEKKADEEFLPKISRSDSSQFLQAVCSEELVAPCVWSVSESVPEPLSLGPQLGIAQVAAIKHELSDVPSNGVKEHSLRETSSLEGHGKDRLMIKAEAPDFGLLLKDSQCFGDIGSDAISEIEMEMGSDFDYCGDPFAASSFADMVQLSDTAKIDGVTEESCTSMVEDNESKHVADSCDSQETNQSFQESCLITNEATSLLKVAGDEASKSRIRSKPISAPCDRELRPLTPSEEIALLLKLKALPYTLESDPACRRLYRKLTLRKLKREMGVPIFELDEVVREALRSSAPSSVRFLFNDGITANAPNVHAVDVDAVTAEGRSYRHPALKDVQVLDRFHFLRQVPKTVLDSTPRSFVSRLLGGDEELRPITSPYTSRVLKPYIRRDFETVPRKLKLFEELYTKLSLDSNCQHRYPIDYCYVQPDHLPAVNAMCSEFFWPGINLTECLQYPEFSCVVLYRKILIGFAFMVPDVKLNEAYISFILVHPDWRCSGIGTFMIYHLIQTCMGKDITLHVSPTNPSMMMYQKFGFKAEELILNFYDKYLPDDSPECKHALLLRLQR